MTELLTAAQMRAIEQAAIASGEVTGLELMERAGRGVVEAIFEEWPELSQTAHRAVVLCGPGNNGGDGFVVARLLKEWGWAVSLWFGGTREAQPADAAKAHDLWCASGGAVFTIPVPFTDRTPRPQEPWRDDIESNFCLVVDALFGIGLSRPIDEASGIWRAFGGHFADARLEEDAEIYRVAIDVPSGLCADSGRLVSPFGPANFRPCFAAELTVATGFPKIGHYIGEGPDRCGKIVCTGLGWLGSTRHGLPGYWNPAEGAPRLITCDYMRYQCSPRGAFGYRPLGKGVRARQDHKYAHGHALILSGPPGHTGAARLAARGALRIGAGLVTVGAAPEAIPEHAAQLTAIMLRPVADAAALEAVLADTRINALCIGPALGLDDRARGLVAAALGVAPDAPPPPAPPHEGEGRRPAGDAGAEASGEELPLPLVGRGEGRGAPRRIVLDADALTLLSRHPQLFAALNENCILTPHAGEFARLFPDIAEKLAAPATRGPAYSKVDAAREAAKRAGCVVLFKGPDTVIADPEGRCSINSAHYDRAAPWLATAGSGDVLSGFIAGLLARGFAPMQAAETAAWLHVECALSFGPGLIAEDLPEELPKVFRKLGL